MKNSSVGQVQQLMLASALHATDTGASERTPLPDREASLQRGVQQPETRDGATTNGTAQQLDRGFDFGQFRHHGLDWTLTALLHVLQNAAMPSPPQTAAADTAAHVRAAGVRRALLIVMGLNTLSAALKIAVGARTGALTVLGAALESMLDMLSNGVAILAVAVAARAPDDDHPYGHEKFETLGTLGIVVFLSITCFELLRESVTALFGGRAAPTGSGTDSALLVLSLVINVFVVQYERARGRALSSALLVADAEHTASDILVTVLAIGSLVLSRFGYVRADALLGFMVALIIAWSGYRILRGTIPILVDERAVEAERLSEIVRAIPGVIGVRSARSRRTASGHLFAEVTILVDGTTSVTNAHDFTDEVERAITRELGTAEAIVHVEPA